MNFVVLMGRMTRDPQIRTISAQSGDMSVVNFTIAVDRTGKDKGADFISCKAFGKTADAIATYFHKGQRIAVQGGIQTGSYTNKDGVKVYTTDVIVNRWEFCENKQQDRPREEEKKPDGMDGFMNVPDGIDEELPFN